MRKPWSEVYRLRRRDGFYRLEVPTNRQNNREYGAEKKTDVSPSSRFHEQSRFSKKVIVSAGISWWGKTKTDIFPETQTANVDLVAYMKLGTRCYLPARGYAPTVTSYSKVRLLTGVEQPKSSWLTGVFSSRTSGFQTGLCSTPESWVTFDSTLTQLSRVSVESAVKPRPDTVFRHLRSDRGVGWWCDPPWRFQTKRCRA